MKSDLDVPVYMVGDSNGGMFISRITPTTLKDYLNQDIVSFLPEIQIEDEAGEVPDYQTPVCCSAVDIVDCYCDETITAAEFKKFMDISTSYDFYAKNSSCVDCENYLEDTCPYLVDIAKNFNALVKENPLTHISELEAAESIIDGNDCAYFEKYNYEENILGSYGEDWSSAY